MLPVLPGRMGPTLPIANRDDLGVAESLVKPQLARAFGLPAGQGHRVSMARVRKARIEDSRTLRAEHFLD